MSVAVDLPQTDDYLRLFLEDTPLLDVRAPIEFSQGAFPTAKNLPLIDNEERHQIGIRYKEEGQESAIQLGHDLVKDEIKTTRIDHWADFFTHHPQGALYCFRGGMRSKISQQWIYDHTGNMYPRVTGGYKALRRFLLNQLDQNIITLQALIIGGRTGVGKTRLLYRVNEHIDLEGIYKHRGSAFGKHARPQPSQIDVENILSINFLKHQKNQNNKLLLEDEAANIGSRRLPLALIQKIKQSPLILLEATINTRVDIVFDEYITQSLIDFQQTLGESNGYDAWADNLTSALSNIQRRLGGERYKVISAIMQDAIYQHRTKGEATHHKVWIYELLANYYDPMYDYQLSKKSNRIMFTGEHDEVLDHLVQQHALTQTR